MYQTEASLLPPLTRQPIRSYVLRGGRVTRAQRRALVQSWKKFGIADQKGMLDLQTAFQRRASTVLEIGFGNGEVLAESAQAAPETNFLGIETYRSGIGSLLHKIEQQGLSNIRIVHEDAVVFVPQRLPDLSLREVLILFPDPWPKTRHHKRRLVQASFIDKIADKLELHGVLQLATDWQDYARAMHSAVLSTRRFRQLNLAQHKKLSTAYGRRGRAAGHAIHYLRYELI